LQPNADGSFGLYAPLKEFRFHPDSIQAKATPTLLPFDEWWNAPVIETGEFTYFSRWELIDIMANQDGACHVSEQLSEKYAAFKKDHFGMHAEHWESTNREPELRPRSEVRPVQNDPAAASARQIAFELALTLHRYIDTLPESDPLRAARQPMYQRDERQSNIHHMQPTLTISIAASPKL
jgi:hypothetical protein